MEEGNEKRNCKEKSHNGKKIIVISDSVHNQLIQRSVIPSVQIEHFLDLGNIQAKTFEEQELDKRFLSERLTELACRADDIDYVFSFIMRDYLKREELADWVLKELVRIGWPVEKVFDGWKIYRSLYPRERYARILSNSNIKKLDGLVFGISYAVAGIRSSYLPGCVVNCASVSQDLYFNYYTAQKIWEMFPQKVSELKYVVIDMFDYTYFNYYTMLTGATVDFFIKSGINCPKEFDEITNKCVAMSAEELNALLKKLWPSSNEYEKSIFQKIFGDMISQDEHAYCDYLLGHRNKMIPEYVIEAYKKCATVASIQIDIFEETIERNIRYLTSLLKFLLEKKPEIKIFLCLLPKYKMVEDFEANLFGNNWKDFFEETLVKLKVQYPFIYLNYKKDLEISANKGNYQDLEHLNYAGSVHFTKKLAAEICNYIEL